MAGMLAILVGVVLLGGAGLLYAEYRQESRVLREAAIGVVDADHQRDPARTVERLTRWVYNNQGFAKNSRYFLSPRFGPTPLQVLESGGDCADKSRLLAAMLDELGIPSTLVMLYAPDYARSTHTVVEARLPGFRAAADPVFDIVFPDGAGGLLGVAQLKQQPERFEARIHALAAERGPASKVAFYPTELESYRWPRTINWERMPVTRLLGSVLGWVVPQPDLLTRPRLLAEPKLLVSVALFWPGLVCVGLGWLLMP
ncbi:transglutaminase-like domain-containing protein [Lamprocystis purpurea]|jgi:transglutaminase-like putative cysteine protease|uniref:transglutaminase-like domain-containing protein n=1 Tax=Lamprocystis purpurea TaxID=61598 RepID=UPI0003999052|nr:transglutaminase-like domain-containing protein [Lamprocystis purpurea]